MRFKAKSLYNIGFIKDEYVKFAREIKLSRAWCRVMKLGDLKGMAIGEKPKLEMAKKWLENYVTPGGEKLNKMR